MSRSELTARLAATLGLPDSVVATVSGDQSFAMLGGSSLHAVDFVAACARAGWDVSLADLMSRTPVAEVLDDARPRPAATTRDGAGPAPTRVQPMLPGQAGMLRRDDPASDRAYHLLFTAEIRTEPGHPPVRPEDVVEAVCRLVERHESLRTYFVPAEEAEEGLWRCVHPNPVPRVNRAAIRVPHGTRAADVVNSSLAGASVRLLEPFRRPPVHFTVTEVLGEPHDPDRPVLLSVLAHHALLDGWSFGVLFQELAALLVGRALPDPALLGMVSVEHARLREAGQLDQLAVARVAALADAPASLELPGDLTRPPHQDLSAARAIGSLSADAVAEWATTAAELGISRSAVLLAAWAAVLARRAGVSEVVVGVPTSGRHRPGWDTLVGPVVQMVPVRCKLLDDASVATYLTGVADELIAAVRAADVPFEELVRRLEVPHDQQRPPLVQAVLAPNDELRNRHVDEGPVHLEVFEGFCGGVGFDLVLQTWSNIGSPDLACDYATAVHTPEEVADLLDSLSATLVEFGGDRTRPARAVRTISAEQRRRLSALRDGPAAPEPATDLWHTVADVAARHPDALAVRDGEPARALTYAGLVRAVEAQAAALVALGVGVGDVVAYALPRSVEEVVTALAALRLGAAYVGLEESDPDNRIRELLELVRPAVLVTGRAAVARMLSVAPRDCRVVAALDPMGVADGDSELAPLPPDPTRVAYIMCTSGSTGVPKAIRLTSVPILRLVTAATGRDAVCRPGDRMMRIAPPAFDLSPFEMYGALTAGACLEIHPDRIPSADRIADFVQTRGITVAWVPAGLFGVIGLHRPECFLGMRVVYTGGEVVAAEAAAAVSAACPGTTVVNGYGPAENGTFTSYHTMTDPSDVDDPMPIGQPVPGTGVLLLDEAGELVPPGAVGEVCTTGAGLAVDYFGAAEATTAVFGRPAPDTGERMYRTGDLARYDRSGRLRFLGRRDHQVKIGGHRVELSEVRERLLACPGVLTAAVVGVRTGTSTVALAAVVPTPDRLVSPTMWHDRLTTDLPVYAVPALWTVVPEIPLTRNGKIDREALRAHAVPMSVLASGDQAAAPVDPPAPHDSGEVGVVGHAADVVADVWTAVLGARPGDPDRSFFEEGGTSLQIAKMVLRLRRKHGLRLEARQLHEAPTLRQMIHTVAARIDDVSKE